MSTVNCQLSIVVGAGASGLMAALTAAQGGAEVLVLERNAQPGRKLGLTGKGRCNLLNLCDRDTFLQNVPRNPRFLYAALDALSPEDTMARFGELGLALKTERGRRVFPASDSAWEVVDVLRSACLRAGVRFVQARADGLELQDGRVTAVTAGGAVYPCRAVAVCTGGLSYPATGSTGDGYALAKQAGHTVTELRASLVPLRVEGTECERLAGLSLRNVRLRAESSDGKIRFDEQGELLFAHFGVTGPLALSASAHIRGEYPCELRIDLKPALDEKRLDDRVLRDFAERGNQQMGNALGGLLPRSLIPVVLERAGIPADTPAHSVTKARRGALVKLLKDFRFTAVGTRPIEEAVITSGGVEVREIEPGTLRSKKVGNLYFAGEILDTDAHTGGYNLQIAWSTGYLAGKNLGG